MQLIHENVVVGDAEVSMRVTTELIVTIDHLTNTAHHPLSLVHWAYTVSVSVENSYWGLLDVAQWNIRGDSVVLAESVVLSILLESAFNSVLEEVGQGLR